MSELHGILGPCRACRSLPEPLHEHAGVRPGAPSVRSVATPVMPTSSASSSTGQPARVPTTATCLTHGTAWWRAYVDRLDETARLYR